MSSEISSGISTFTAHLFKELVVHDAKSNIFFSAFSIATALALAGAGAKGETESEIFSAFKINLKGEDVHVAISKILIDSGLFNVQGGPLQLSLANKLWLENTLPVEEQYLQWTKKYYQAVTENADFAKNTENERIRINSWVEQNTQGKIQNLIAPKILTADTAAVLTNAIYFKGSWVRAFNPRNTSEMTFMKLSGEKIQAQFMSEKIQTLFTHQADFKAIEKPYKSAQGNNLAMVLILPEDQGVDGIKKTLEGLVPNRANAPPFFLTQLFSAKVQVKIPKFKVEFSFEAVPFLQKLGIKKAFEGADFSGISAHPLVISNVIHKAFVDVNEEGTEAAAATAVMMSRGRSSNENTFVADRPFLFLIWDRTSQLILFSGLVNDPTKEK